MRKIIALTTALVMTMGLAGCGENAEPTIENSSSLYSEEDMDNAMKYMQQMIDDQDGILDSVTYLGDELCTAELALERLDGAAEKNPYRQGTYTDYMGFDVDFHYSKSPVKVIDKLLDGNWRYITYPAEHHQVWLGRNEDGEWEELCLLGGDILGDYMMTYL